MGALIGIGIAFCLVVCYAWAWSIREAYRHEHDWKIVGCTLSGWPLVQCQDKNCQEMELW